MTTNTPSQDLVPVTQADNNAAMHWKAVWGTFAERLPEEDLAYAFARHAATARKEGEAHGMERAAGIAERALSLTPLRQEVPVAAKRIARAIREASNEAV